MSAPTFRALRRVSLLSELCEAGPSRPRSLRTSAALAAKPVLGRFPMEHDKPLSVEATDRPKRRTKYGTGAQRLSSQYQVREGKAKTKVLLNQMLDDGTLPWDVPGDDMYAVSGAVNWCLSHPSGKRDRLALRLVHTHLSLTLEPTPHTARYQASRSHQYAWFMSQFLRADELTETLHSNAQSLLQRQMTERVPLQPWIVGRVLAALRPPLNDILPLLPELDNRNYASMLRLMIQDYAPLPSELREYVATTRGPEEEWSYDVLAALVYSHFPSLDFRGALVALGALRTKAQKDKAAALKNGQLWPPTDGSLDVLKTSYADVMSLWSRSRFHRTKRNPRLNSTVPSKLAADLVQLLRADEEEVELAPAFLNTWFNAERIAENHTNVNKVWEHISGSSIDATLEGHIARPVDRDAIVAFLKYLKVHKTEAERHNLRPLLAHLPFRDGSVLNAFLAVLGVHPDLNLVIAILQSDLYLDPRGVDLCSAVVIYHIRRLLSQPWTTRSVFVDGFKFPMDSGARGNNISFKEWDWIAKLLGHQGTPTAMPLTTPTAELEERAEVSENPKWSKWYGPMSRVVVGKDALDEKVSRVRPALTEAIKHVSQVLAKRDGVDPLVLQTDLEEAQRLIKSAN
ncbi:hypothetical protein A1Q2_02996 [Trichosporon asahii var. asahii CBS 8904]|uniref:Uncharacterized protein n=1 Tax=Trichosporon asahii var. asahii (strain CBS 8904) TaxID=1220162 RepID=K1VQ80_TRIAC|nr:hypothetical protein A1Q2_02996 [Trichosporon asahii var. asahii CBS 8904]